MTSLLLHTHRRQNKRDSVIITMIKNYVGYFIQPSTQDRKSAITSEIVQ